MDNNVLDSKTQELIDKLNVSRDKLETYGIELETLKKKVEDIFPAEVTYRSKWAVEEKVKAVSEFFNSLLRIRVEINKTIKDEITIRTNIQTKNKEGFSEEDIRQLAEDLDELKKEKEKGNDKSEQKLKAI